MPYDNYDYAAVYTEDLENLPEERELPPQDIKCLYRTKSTPAGEMMEISAYTSFLTRKDFSRAKKHKPSREQQQNLNRENARKKIIRQVNANFTTGDLWGTFGWDNERMPTTLDDAFREVDNWIGRVNYHGKKAGLPLLKYMYTIEETEGDPAKGEPPTKYHVHIVMDGLHDRDTLERRIPADTPPPRERLWRPDRAFYVHIQESGREKTMAA